MSQSKPRIRHRMLDHWDNLDGTIERGYAGLSIWDWHELPTSLAALHRLRPRQCLHRHQWRRPQQCRGAGCHPDIALSGKGGSAGASVPTLWNQGLFLRALFRAHRDRRAEDRRSTRSRGEGVVAGQGGRNLSPHSRFRRLSRQGEFGRPAGPAGLWPQPRRWRQHARRRADAAWRHRDLARLRLFGGHPR